MKLKKIEISGQFNFEKIGVPYPAEVPLRALRFLPAFCGSLLTPTVYLLLCQLGLSPWAGAIAGILVIFGRKCRLSSSDSQLCRNEISSS